MVGATKDSIVMVEGEMKEISKTEMLEGLNTLTKKLKVQIEAQEKISSENSCISQTKREYCHETHNEEIREKVWAECYDKVYNVAKTPSAKEERHENLLQF